MGFIVLYQFLISLEEIGLSSSTSAPPCSFVELELVIFYFTRLPLALLASTARINYGNTTLENRWQNEWHRMLGDITVSLARRLMLQCPRCFRRVGIFAKEFAQGCMFHLDHNTTRYIKAFGLSQFSSAMKKHEGYVKKIILECFKLRGNMCTFCHEFGIGTRAYESRLKMKRVLIYGRMTVHAFPDKKHLTVREVFSIKEFANLIVDWWKAGAWKQSATPQVSFEYLAVSLWTQLGICIHDVSKLTKENYRTTDRMSRNRYITDIISCVAIKLSGSCLGDCPECLLNIVPVCISGIPYNHKDPKNKKNKLSVLKHDIWGWIKEALGGHCDPNCDACHGIITAWQKAGGVRLERPAFYDGR